MKLSRFLSLLIVLLNINSFAQKEANIWYFGYHAGLDFNTNPPSVLTNGMMQQIEGCSSVSDASGQLLFYTDGVTVWNKNHNVMVNGTGLYGNTSSTNSGLIFPFPGNQNMYYIFTTDYDYGSNGLRYSTVDISMNGGLGQVIQKNIMLLSSSAEKLAAVKHANEHDIWLIAHEKHNNNFVAYLITDLGIGSPIYSAVGSTLVGSQGQLKVSKCANKIAQADYVANLVEVYDFNKISGTVSNPHSFNYSDHTYGVEFSPNEKYLYASVSYWDHKVYQIDLTTYSSNLILDYSVATPGSLQLAPNGKIYIGNYNYALAIPYDYLGVINNPDLPGSSCNIVENGVFLNTNGTTQSFMGLPTILANYPKILDIGNDTNLCTNDSVYLNAGSGFLTYLWQDGSTDSSYYATSTGTYWCRVTSDCNNLLTDTVIISIGEIPIVNLGPDTSICAGNSVTFNAGNGNNYSYHWQNGSTNSTFTTSSTGIYSVTVTNNCGSNADTVQVLNIYPKPEPNLGNDSTICSANSILLDAGNGYSSYLWQNGFTGQILTVNTGGVYSVTVSNSHGCHGSDTVVFAQLDNPSISLGSNRDLCENTTIVLDPGPGFDSYHWQDGSSSQTFTVSSGGVYSVTVTNFCGLATSSVTISDCPECICNIPNAFTPNYDGENDVLFVKGKGFIDLEFTVFNRLGEQVFISHNIDYGWDGKWLGLVQKNEVYIYIIKAKCLNGKKIFLKGNVTLLR